MSKKTYSRRRRGFFSIPRTPFEWLMKIASLAWIAGAVCLLNLRSSTAFTAMGVAVIMAVSVRFIAEFLPDSATIHSGSREQRFKAEWRHGQYNRVFIAVSAAGLVRVVDLAGFSPNILLLMLLVAACAFMFTAPLAIFPVFFVELLLVHPTLPLDPNLLLVFFMAWALGQSGRLLMNLLNGDSRSNWERREDARVDRRHEASLRNQQASIRTKEASLRISREVAAFKEARRELDDESRRHGQTH